MPLLKHLCHSVSYAAAALLAGGLLAMPAQATVDPVYFLTTGQTGAQTQIDIAHTTEWQFTATSDWLLGGGDFTMKDGPHTQSANPDDSSVVLTIYEGTKASHGIPLASFKYNSDNSNTPTFRSGHPGNSQSYDYVPFHFDNPFSIVSTHQYYIALTSPVADSQSDAYFIKGFDNVSFLDSNNQQPPDQTVSTDTPAIDTPEPVSLTLLATGLVGLGVARRRRRG